MSIDFFFYLNFNLGENVVEKQLMAQKSIYTYILHYIIYGRALSFP